jgi:hypothetical protein
MTIAITGGTGFVGQALIDQAQAQGLVVQALARKPQERRDGIDWIEGGLADRDALARLVAGARRWCTWPGSPRRAIAAEFEVANVAGTLAVVEAMRKAGVRALFSYRRSRRASRAFRLRRLEGPRGAGGPGEPARLDDRSPARGLWPARQGHVRTVPRCQVGYGADAEGRSRLTESCR